MIHCDTCPYCKDSYPGKVDSDGNHFCICGMTGNMVYTEPRRVKKWSGPGYLKFGISSCGIFETVEKALENMTDIERRRWRELHEDQNSEETDPPPRQMVREAQSTESV